MAPHGFGINRVASTAVKHSSLIGCPGRKGLPDYFRCPPQSQSDNLSLFALGQGTNHPPLNSQQLIGMERKLFPSAEVLMSLLPLMGQELAHEGVAPSQQLASSPEQIFINCPLAVFSSSLIWRKDLFVTQEPMG